jgi:hypothetical protein
MHPFSMFGGVQSNIKIWVFWQPNRVHVIGVCSIIFSEIIGNLSHPAKNSLLIMKIYYTLVLNLNKRSYTYTRCSTILTNPNFNNTRYGYIRCGICITSITHVMANFWHHIFCLQIVQEPNNKHLTIALHGRLCKTFHTIHLVIQSLVEILHPDRQKINRKTLVAVVT